jgi:hypothetical protein
MCRWNGRTFRYKKTIGIYRYWDRYKKTIGIYRYWIRYEKTIAYTYLSLDIKRSIYIYIFRPPPLPLKESTSYGNRILSKRNIQHKCQTKYSNIDWMIDWCLTLHLNNIWMCIAIPTRIYKSLKKSAHSSGTSIPLYRK